MNTSNPFATQAPAPAVRGWAAYCAWARETQRDAQTEPKKSDTYRTGASNDDSHNQH